MSKSLEVSSLYACAKQIYPKGGVKRAVLVIDMLNDFVLEGAPLEVPGAREIIKNIKNQLNRAHRNRDPVIYLCDAHKKDDPEFSVWPVHAVKGTRGQEVVKELTPKKSDYIVNKTTYSGFFGTKLANLLKSLKVKELILTGVCTEICVLYTGVDALMKGYRIIIPEDCTAALTEEGKRFGLKQLNEVLKPRKS